MARKHMKKCLKSQIVRRMQIKTMRYYIIPLRMTINKKDSETIKVTRMWTKL